MMRLINVRDFGGVDADDDALLAECFQDHDAFRDAWSHRRSIIVGRKGSGKTAIFKHLTSLQVENVFSAGLTFADYPWEYHDQQKQSGVPGEHGFTESWQFLVLITLAKILLNQDQSQPYDARVGPAFEGLAKFMQQSYGSINPELAGMLSPAQGLRLEYLQIPGFVKVGLTPQSGDRGRSTITRQLNRQLWEVVLSCLNPDNRYYICFDELEYGFVPGDENYSQRLIGLLLAARRLNVKARNSGKRLSVVVFLRDDIYERLRFDDKNKLTETQVSVIEWDTARTRRTLRGLMELRFQAVLGNVDASWKSVFDEYEKIDRQSKYDFMLDRTYRRPRDMIKFCNEVLKCYKLRKGEDRLSNKDLFNACSGYSTYLYQELVDEVHKKLPRYEDYIELLRSLGKLNFRIEDFDQILGRKGRRVALGQARLEILQELFDNSIIGFLKVGGIGAGSHFVWKYLESGTRFDNLSTRFQVHSGLKEALGLRIGSRVSKRRVVLSLTLDEAWVRFVGQREDKWGTQKEVGQYLVNFALEEGYDLEILDLETQELTDQ